MSQEETGRMLTAVIWANKRLARMGLGESCAIVYSFGAVRLLDAAGRELSVVEGRDSPEAAIMLLLARFEAGLRDVLSGKA